MQNRGHWLTGLSLVVLSSCGAVEAPDEVGDIEQPTNSDDAFLMFSEGFEHRTDFTEGRSPRRYENGYGTDRTQTCEYYGACTTDSMSLSAVDQRQGRKQLTVKFRHGDQWVSSWSAPERAELSTRGRYEMGFREDYWVGISVFVPDTYEMSSVSSPSIVQFVTSLGTGVPDRPAKPTFSLRIKNGKFEFGQKYESLESRGAGVVIERTGIRTGQWTDWVFHLRWSDHGCDEDRPRCGLLEVWKEGEKLFTKRGQNIHTQRSDFGMHMKFGIYEHWENLEQGQRIPDREIRFDAIRIAKGRYAKNMVDVRRIGLDPECTDRSRHIQDASGTYCCPKQCGTCGGSGCADRLGGPSMCCGGEIAKLEVTCTGDTAPCIID